MRTKRKACIEGFRSLVTMVTQRTVKNLGHIRKSWPLYPEKHYDDCAITCKTANKFRSAVRSAGRINHFVSPKAAAEIRTMQRITSRNRENLPTRDCRVINVRNSWFICVPRIYFESACQCWQNKKCTPMLKLSE